MNETVFDLDAFRQHVLDTDPLVRDVWNDKYRWKRPDGTSDELTVAHTRRRVVEAVYAQDTNKEALRTAHAFVQAGIVIPAGRVNAGAGTGRSVSLINCMVSKIIQDCMPGIQLNIAEAALTMQQGCGIGSDYSPIRPAGALVHRTGSVASGVISFADQQDSMCTSIMSAGTRRGAMMLTLRDDHPDLWNERQWETAVDGIGRTFLTHPSFISAKTQRGRLFGFNVSVLVSEQFMKAVREDKEWDLGHHCPPADDKYIEVLPKAFPYNEFEMDNEFNTFTDDASRKKGEILPWYVYRRVRARQIWDDMLRTTYKYAEPGIIFIDRINERNNLYYCEEIRCTNPCGEQPLPPNGACCLGSVNLAFLVRHPFTPHASFDYRTYSEAIACGVRLLDNVLDVSNYPLAGQAIESRRKRRIGLGVTGFGDMLVQLGVRYDTPDAVALAEELSNILMVQSFRTSSYLAAERGPFPDFDREKFLAGYNARRLPPEVVDLIGQNGIRNGVLNTIAPNGTISIYTGNVSTGHEPVFSFAPMSRDVKQPDGTTIEYTNMPYSLSLYRAMQGVGVIEQSKELPDYFIGALDISVKAHVDVHAAWQKHIDASVSKTINCPTSMTFDEFKTVYDMAYTLGAKGCTTYRPDSDSGRGSVIREDAVIAPPVAPIEPVVSASVAPRPLILEGRTHKVKWPQDGSNWYVGINQLDGQPYEVFINTRDAQHTEWVQAVSLLLTAVLRRGGDVRFLAHELMQIHSPTGGAFIPQQHGYRPSIPAAIGGILEEEFKRLGLYEVAVVDTPQTTTPKVVPVTVTFGSGRDSCPECGASPLVHESGCVRCLNCTFNKCG